MSTETTLREPAADPLAAQLRATLDAVAADPDAGPHTGPDWARLATGMQRARRARRLRGVRRVAIAAIAVAAVGAGTMTGVVPYPSFAPTVTLSSAGGHSALWGQPTKGSLAGDDAWLTALRERVADGAADHEAGGEFWRPPAADGLKVLYAGDVGAYRAALVEGDWHRGPVAAPQQVWYLGEVGSAASAMARGSNGDPEDADPELLQPTIGVYADRDGRSRPDTVAVVVSAGPVDVELAAAPVIDAAGTVHPDRRPVAPSEAGVYTQVITGAGQYTMLLDGKDRTGPITAKGMLTGDDSVYAKDWTPLREGPDVHSGMVGALGELARQTTLQDPATGRFALLAAADPGTAPRPVAGVLTLPSGARVLVGGSIIKPNAFGTDAAVIVPAGKVGDLAFAWQSVPAEFGDRPDWTAAVGPVGTVTVQWVHGDGTVTSSEAYHAMASVRGHDVTRVRFLNALGDGLATRAVTPALLDQSGGAALPKAGVQSGG